MHRTIFQTPIINTVLRHLSLAFLKARGWKIQGSLDPAAQRSVLIAAPHTSNWDLPYTLMFAFALQLNIYWMGKVQIFRPPFRGLMMWLGGIPVVREQSNQLVSASARALQTATSAVQLVVPPEGTRSQTRSWKTGFYYIATTAKVPIVMAYLDFGSKTGGLGPLFHPTGDVEADMLAIKSFYAPFKGKNPQLFATD